MDLSKAVWRKASRTHAEGDNCVQVASIPETIAIRDSKDPEGPRLLLTPQDFQQLTETIKNL